jgi:serine/threonine-protein kinase
VPERYLGRTLGKFRIDALAGSGGFAWVYKAWDPELDIPVALKVLKPQYAGDEVFEERFRREASTAAKLRHPNIVKIFAVGRDGEAVYFAMDYLPHGLADRLDVVSALPEDVLVRLGIDVSSALGFAHRQGVIHRDIKVDNILFDEHGNAVVADFGIARAMLNYAQQTGTNMVVGTPQYFSPEQARGLPLDGRADIYSLGITLFRAATGTLPFNGDDWYQIARQHVEERPPSPRALNRDLSRDFERILLRCLAKDPADRFATGEDLCHALESLSSGQRTSSAARTLMLQLPAGGFSTPRTPRPHLRWATAISRRAWIGAGATALALAGTLLVTRNSVESAPPTIEPREPVRGLAPADSNVAAPPAIAPESVAPPARRVPPRRRRVLSVTAPRGAALTVNGARVASGSWRSDTLAAGRYVLVADLSSVPGCPTSRETEVVMLPDSGSRSVRLSPARCGTLRLDIRTPGADYSVRAENGREVRSGRAPVLFPLVLPEGRYRVIVEAPYCTPFDSEERVVADSTTTRPVRQICGDGER